MYKNKLPKLCVVVGFTGTREGMSVTQKIGVRRALSDLVAKHTTLVGLHGDCIGADAEFEELCAALDIPTYCYPCELYGRMDHKFRANTSAVILEGPTQPLHRNEEIVNNSRYLLAAPLNGRKDGEIQFTISRARQRDDLDLRIFQ